MALIIEPASNRSVVKRRECFRIEVEVGGTDAVPVYTIRGHCFLIIRDSVTNDELGKLPGTKTITIENGQIGAALRTGIGNLVNRIDGEPHVP